MITSPRCCEGYTEQYRSNASPKSSSNDVTVQGGHVDQLKLAYEIFYSHIISRIEIGERHGVE